VRVFLFKDGHIEKYKRLTCNWPTCETRSKFETFAQKSLYWLEEELSLARPRLVITLGAEVVGVLQNEKKQKERNALLGGGLKEFKLGTSFYPVIHLAHPGIVMRPVSKSNPWPQLHCDEHIPAAKKVLKQFIG
jgi:uracil-DNA glycosylase